MQRISYSKVSTLLSCPRKIYFERIGLEHPLPADLAIGSSVHHALAGYIRSDDDPLELLERRWERYLSGDRELETHWTGELSFRRRSAKQLLETARDAILAYIPFLDEVLSDGTPEGIELHLEAPLSDRVILHGFIDLLLPDRIIDFKFASRRFRPNELQAACYSLLVAENLGARPFEFHVLLKEQPSAVRVKPIPLDTSRLEFYKTFVLKPAAEILSGSFFPANPSFVFCSESFCPYWSYCIGSVSDSLRERRPYELCDELCESHVP